ncbi:MAG: 2Fe-2S iron-sulfur cluster-binding protein [Candidatus Izemoplasmatales bacterium]
MALTVYALKKENKNASEEEIKSYLVGNLCRCTGYVAQHEAIKRYLGDES